MLDELLQDRVFEPIKFAELSNSSVNTRLGLRVLQKVVLVHMCWWQDGEGWKIHSC